MINGSEGRKDPACSLYTHLRKAPLIIFHDFSSGLEEYVFNSEAGYFKNNQFYHDLFQGVNHKCPEVYNSLLSPGNRRWNTSICEQFNSFLQNIKSLSKRMGQIKFVYLCQLMINEWNEDKKASFFQMMKVAYDGSL